MQLQKSGGTMSYSYHKHKHVSVVRYFTVFGPGRPDMSIYIYQMENEGANIEMYGDGSQSRDFTYVDDIARVPLRFRMLDTKSSI